MTSLSTAQPRLVRSVALAMATAVACAVPLAAQQPAAPPRPAQTGPAVGTMAPDFAVTGATRYGLLRDPVRLSELRGKTVVLAFFFKARTRG
jgi:hypothetical protein